MILVNVPVADVDAAMASVRVHPGAIIWAGLWLRDARIGALLA